MSTTLGPVQHSQLPSLLREIEKSVGANVIPFLYKVDSDIFPDYDQCLEDQWQIVAESLCDMFIDVEAIMPIPQIQKIWKNETHLRAQIIGQIQQENGPEEFLAKIVQTGARATYNERHALSLAFGQDWFDRQDAGVKCQWLMNLRAGFGRFIVSLPPGNTRMFMRGIIKMIYTTGVY